MKLYGEPEPVPAGPTDLHAGLSRPVIRANHMKIIQSKARTLALRRAAADAALAEFHNAIREAVDAGVRQTDIAEAGGIGPDRVYQINKHRD